VDDTEIAGTLESIWERLEVYGEDDLEQDIQEFAKSEVIYDDPLQAHRIEPGSSLKID
jgi:hypothetical protein